MCPIVVAPCPTGTNASYFLAQVNVLVVYYHLYFELVTSILVTPSAIDAGFNAVAVLILDRISEDVMDKPTYLLVFFLTAILGNLLTLAEGPNYASAGASGGIFGIFAAVFSYEWARDKKIENITLVFFLLIFIGSSFLIPDVNWVAHVGGAIGGFLAGPLLYRSSKTHISDYSVTTRSNPIATFGTVALLLLMTIGSIIQFILFAIG
jgi:rhomboid protease GluP